jgi:exodeoxyribonuclease VII large subunit
VVTSATGAAIHDIVNVLRRRGAGLRLLLRPVRVQGDGAAAEIAEAIADHNRLGVADVLIVGRGGGSLEDLWAFNEEVVARAIHASAIPVISAVGHEVDTTIADFVADLRAPTPSAAAELVARSRLELEGHLDHLAQRLAGQMQGRLELLAERARGLTRRLRSPRQQLMLWRQRHADLARRLDRVIARRQQEAAGNLATLSGRLDLLSPLRTLERGYAIIFAEKTGKAVLNADTLAAGDRLQLRFARGRAAATVDEAGE